MSLISHGYANKRHSGNIQSRCFQAHRILSDYGDIRTSPFICVYQTIYNSPSRNNGRLSNGAKTVFSLSNRLH